MYSGAILLTNWVDGKGLIKKECLQSTFTSNNNAINEDDDDELMCAEIASVWFYLSCVKTKLSTFYAVYCS